MVQPSFLDGDSNVFIGSETKPAADDESNQIIIGANAIGKGSNTALIGDDNITDIYMSEDVGATLHTGTVSGSSVSTGSFGLVLGDGSQLSNLPASFTSAGISGSFTDVSSSLAGRITTEEGNVDTLEGRTLTAGNGLTGGGTLASDRTFNVGAGTGIDVAADAISVDVSDFMTNGSNNRVVTATGTDAMNAEANLTFDGTTLSGSATSTGSFGHLMVGGGNFTSASLASGGGSGAVSAVANGANNRIATFSSSDALNGEANLTFDGTTFIVQAGADERVINANATTKVVTLGDIDNVENSNTFVVDDVNNKVYTVNQGANVKFGINTTAPPKSLTVTGEISASSNIFTEGGIYLDGKLGLSNSSTTLSIGADDYWTSIKYGKQATDSHNFFGTFTNVSGSATSTGSFGVLDLIKFAPSSTGGTSNTAFGENAGSGLVTNGNYNSLYGANAGEDLSTGDDNVIIGYNAAKDVTTTSDMVVIGAYAMEGADANDVGTQGSVAIGYKSNYAATDTSRNVSVGFETLMTETTGDESVAIGYKALRTQNGVQGSVGNVAVGREALLNTTTGIKNLALGDQAGKLITTGTKNTIIGAGANPSSGSSENEIVIGSGSIGLGDNQTVIGNSSQTHVVFGGDALISGSATSTGSFGQGYI